MNFIELEANRFWGELYNATASRLQLFEKLIYGHAMQYFDTITLFKQQVTLYLHEDNPQILIAINQLGMNKVFNLKQIKTYKSDYKLEMSYPLHPTPYLVLQQEEDELILLFDSADSRDEFNRLFMHVVTEIWKLPVEIDSTMMRIFVKADRNKNQQISYDELIYLFQTLKISNQDQVRNYTEFLLRRNKNKKKFSYIEFQMLAKLLACREQFVGLFEKYSCSISMDKSLYFVEYMKKEDFRRFLALEQHEIQSEIERLCQVYYPTDGHKISFLEFCLYLTGPHNEAAGGQKQVEMGHPLYLYYCYSSHNTYLTGNQLTSDSRWERYLQDLQNGVRCVEIDCHDGPLGPIVKHGYTPTSWITFEQVILKINQFCTLNPKHTPIILSLENHCELDNQKVMVDILNKHFGQKIMRIKQYQDKDYPTLEQALGRIIIKGTGTLQFYNQIEQGQQSAEQLITKLLNQQQRSEPKSEDDVVQQLQQNEPPLEQASDNNSQESVNKSSEQYYEFSQFQARKQQFLNTLKITKQSKYRFDQVRSQIKTFISKRSTGQKSVKTPKNVCKELVAITAMLGNGVVSKPSPWESKSQSENSINKYLQKEKQVMIAHTAKGWIRSYPAATRFDSCNYNPLPAMEMGVQIIALNTQVADEPTFIMKQFFRRVELHSAGYRLKDPSQPEKIKKLIKITPISGMKISFNDSHQKLETPNCTVEMIFYGSTEDYELNPRNSWQAYTQSISNNCFNPIFHEKSTMRLQVVNPSLAFVLIRVQGCGTGVLALDSLRSGYRTVTLHDDQLYVKDSKIFCLIQI